MELDHSRTYTEKKLRNLPHILRLKDILKILDTMSLQGKTYCDVGCSNGYLTNLIYTLYRCSKAKGLDHEKEHLSLARSRYPDIDFQPIDLNVLESQEQKYDVVTCFETLEHVGNIEVAIDNLVGLVNDRGALLITVPVEVGIRGIIKFLVKTLVFQYKLDEINVGGDKFIYYKYFLDLLLGRSISKYRRVCAGYGTHFGFDYRVVQDIFKHKGIEFLIKIKGSTVFFVIAR